MPCYYPLRGWYSKVRNASGKRSIVFQRSGAISNREVALPCGVCIGCRLEHSRQWAMRCMHEAQMHDDNCFLTLTYDDDHLPAYRSLVKRDFQLFMKRLRKRYGSGVRFYGCGEYGDQMGRPHYHICLFGLDFSDKSLWKTVNGNKIYISDSLSELWPFGFSVIGNLTFESAAYVARYCLKKRKGKDWRSHYERIDADTGECVNLEPEFALMSRRPGIGTSWYEKYNSEVFPLDRVVVNAREVKPPKFYFSKLEKLLPHMYGDIKRERRNAGYLSRQKNSLARLHVKNYVKEQTIKNLQRSL